MLVITHPQLTTDQLCLCSICRKVGGVGGSINLGGHYKTLQIEGEENIRWARYGNRDLSLKNGESQCLQGSLKPRYTGTINCVIGAKFLLEMFSDAVAL